ncbi:methyltransferase domain-containing protein [Nocardioides limicola]|uniref:methyltransferase domain-containing protein n=1 Tax=Nocardioides limicola TaxID=2803368 RepID=UPI0027DDB8C8|nr:methyltransferase domain-containing protein [Nocardioides sp. DJM-14]
MPYRDQVLAKDEACRALVGSQSVWLPPVTGPESGFRNKAKMVVGGSTEQPTLGILDPTGGGVDLRDCGLHSPGLVAALPALAEFISTAGLVPYDVPSRRGELKHLLVTESPDAELMVRFVMRSTEALARIRKHLPSLLTRLPVRVASVNVQPEHKAVLEGAREILLTDQEALPMRLGVVDELTLWLRPASFFQTNTEVAARLYATARNWVDEELGERPAELWDLYCGVGGFGLHCASGTRRLVGVEASVEAVRSAEASRDQAGLGGEFVAGDAVAFARARTAAPDLVIVNPPRRGIGPELAGWLESSGVPRVLYSSCHAETLAADLASMPSLRPMRAQLMDMFPQTRHYEVLVLLSRV